MEVTEQFFVVEKAFCGVEIELQSWLMDSHLGDKHEHFLSWRERS